MSDSKCQAVIRGSVVERRESLLGLRRRCGRCLKPNDGSDSDVILSTSRHSWPNFTSSADTRPEHFRAFPTERHANRREVMQDASCSVSLCRNPPTPLTKSVAGAKSSTTSICLSSLGTCLLFACR